MSDRVAGGEVEGPRDGSSPLLPRKDPDRPIPWRTPKAIGAGTVHRFTLTLAGKARTIRARVDEPVPGRVLTETEPTSGMVTTFSVEPSGDRECHVRIITEYEARGMRGIAERLAVPKMLERLYQSELALLERYALSRGSSMELTVVATSGAS